MIDSYQYYFYLYAIIFVGYISVIAIELFFLQTQDNTISYAIAQSSLTNTPIVNDNSEEQNKSNIIKAFGHFANNQIKDGIVTWIQGGFWELKINNIITKDSINANNKNSLLNDNGNEANFIANFTMIKPDGSLSHTHNIKNFISDNVIVTDKDIVVMGTGDIYSDNNTNEYKKVPITVHLMGKKVLGLTIDVSKTEGHFSSPNEMFGTLISGVGLNTSSIDNSNKKMMIHHYNATNDTIEEESMTMMQH